MHRYIVTRLLLAIPTLVGAAALVFVLMRLIPGDVCVIRLGSGGAHVEPGGARRCAASSSASNEPLILQFFDFPEELRDLRLRHLDVVGQSGLAGDPDPPAGVARRWRSWRR